MTEITRILTAIDRGDARAANKLLPLVYDELRRLAAQRLSHEKPGQTLQATALIQSLPSASAAYLLFPTRAFNQNPPHRLGGGSEEMATALPMLIFRPD